MNNLDTFVEHGGAASLLASVENTFEKNGGHGEGKPEEYGDEVEGEEEEAADDSDTAVHFNSLGRSFHNRFKETGGLDDINQAVTWHSRTVELSPDEPKYLSDLGRSFMARFTQTAEPTDMEQGLKWLRHAVALASDGHPDEPEFVNYLGVAFRERFNRLGELADIEEAITLQHRAVELTSEGDPDKPLYLTSLGNSCQRRFERVGNLADVEDAITMLRRAVELTPDGHPDKPASLNDLGNSCGLQFEHLGELADVEDAITVQHRAVELTPDSHPNKPGYLNNLGLTCHRRFEHLGELADAEDAMTAHRRAVELTPDSHPNKSMYLSNLGNSCDTRFEHLGNLADVEDAMTAHRRAVELTPDSHPNKAVYLICLGLSCHRQLEHLGDLADMEDAMTVLRRAVELTPEGHPLRAYGLMSLAATFQSSLELLPSQSNFESACELYKIAAYASGPIRDQLDAAMQCTELYVDYPNFLDSAENVLSMHARVLELIPEAVWLSHSVSRRFEEVAKIGDAVSAATAAALSAGDKTRALEWFEEGRAVVWSQILNLRAPLDDLRQEHPQHADRLAQLSAALEHASQRGTPTASEGGTELHIASSLEEEAVRHRRLAEEYSKLLAEIRQLKGLEGFLRPKMTEELSRVAVDGPVACINVQKSRCDALVLLPSETAIIHHIPLPMLTLPQATRLRDLWGKYRAGRAQEAVNSSGDSILESAPCMLSSDIDNLRQILSTFASQSQPSGPQTTSISSKQSPSKMSARAMKEQRATDRDEDVNMGWGESKKCAYDVDSDAESYDEVRSILISENDYRVEHARKHKPRDSDFPPLILAYLWESVVKPVLELLADNTKGGDLPCITWCTTGALAFLPLHAAGIYGFNSHFASKAFNRVISTYAPTLTSLLPGVRAVKSTSDPSILVLAQPNTPDQSRLPGTLEEAQHIHCLFPSSSEILHGEDGTVDAVLEAIQRHPWIHLACHGTQNAADPTQSAFLLHDGRLNLNTLMASTSDISELAFLSACETAMGDEKVPDEAVHLAAGFRSVIATMWSISDNEAPLVAKKFYEELLEQRGKGKRLDVAYALHAAIAALREKVGEMNFAKWVPFVHYGI